MTERTALMVLVSVLLLAAFTVQSLTLATTVLAESSVGVEIGDWVKYDFAFAIASDKPIETPPDLIEMNKTEWVKNIVRTVSDTTITFERVVHYKDGNETKSDEYVKAATGASSTNGQLMFIQSNLGKDDLVHASLTEHYSINETIRQIYIGATRDINHLNVSTTFYEGSSVYVITSNHYWDKATGVLCERLGLFVTSDGTDTTSIAVSEKIVDTNIWVGEPDTQPPIAEAGQDQTAIKGTSVTFDASDSLDNIGITSYEWDFGDGNTGIGLIATHTYAKTGSYVVTLTVWDAAGNSNTDEITVNVEEALLPPIVGVSALAAFVLLGLFIWRWKKRGRKR